MADSNITVTTSPNINKFIGSFTKDLARPCNYSVFFTLPQKFFTSLDKMRGTATGGASSPLNNVFGSINSNEDLQKLSAFRCEQAELPPRAFSLVQQKTYGPLEYYPIQNVYNKSAMTFIVGDDMKEKLFFDLWMETICASHPDFNYVADNSVRFDFDYKTNYVGDVIVTQMDLTGKPSYSVALRDAFPTEVYSLPLSWAQQNDYHRLQVVFTYRYFYVRSNPKSTQE